MKQKINLRLIAISILAILATMVCITYVYYGLFQEQIKRDLKAEARLLSEAGISGLVENEAVVDDEEIRITWIGADGNVLFDNDADAGILSNHLDRPEVRDAFTSGAGESVRESDTMNMKTFYVAVLLSDGTVLRVATQARSILNVFLSTFPVVAAVIAVIIFLCILISHLLTKQLLQPIQEMAENLDGIPDRSAYKELDPFVDRIREQHENILAAVKSRQDFTANVSHELKTPITAISGYAELIENQMVNEKQQVKYAGDIRKNADRLLSLINDIIRLSELDHAANTPDFSKVDLPEVVRERLELLQHTARDKNVTVELHGPHSAEITSNRGMLVELVDNLVQNAIRYNVPNGKVDIYAAKEGNHGILMVSDTGIGIPEADRQRVFERFYRVDKSRSRETGGTGLGLAIVKHIVELHGGEIELESELGKGTEIKIIL